MQLDRIFAAQRVALYGAGVFSHQVLKVLMNLGVRADCFLDINKKGCFAGLPILHPFEDIPMAERCNTTVLISVFNHYFDIGQIQRNLLAHGYKNVINPVRLAAIADDEYGFLWLNNRITDGNTMPEDVHSLFADARSTEIFLELLRFRRTGDYTDTISYPDIKNIYQNPVARHWFAGRSFSYVDCGAYDGDSIRGLLDRGNKLKSCMAFEPAIDNYLKLRQYLESDVRLHEADSVLALRCAVGEADAMVECEAAGHGARVGKGADIVQCVALDAVIYSNADYIKLDIEGYETQALRGAAQLIGRCRPALAISLYHRADDLFEIPKMLHGWQIDYDLYLRLHGYNGMDAVLYALPRKA